MKISNWLDPDNAMEAKLYSLLETKFDRANSHKDFIRIFNDYPVAFENKLKDFYPKIRFLMGASNHDKSFFQLELTIPEIDNMFNSSKLIFYIWVKNNKELHIEADYITNFENFVRNLRDKLGIVIKENRVIDVISDDFEAWLEKV